MHRRTLLRAGAAGLGTTALLGVGSAAGSARSTGSQDEYGPLGSVEIETAKEAVRGDGDVTYLAVDDGYASVDVSDPANPTILAERRGLAPGEGEATLAGVWDVKYANDRLLVMAQTDFRREERFTGFLLVDVSDPASPERVLFHETEFPIHNGFFDGERAYFGASADVTESMSVYDVGDDGVERLGGWGVLDADSGYDQVYPGGSPAAHDLWVRDDVAYLACWDAGAWLVDVSDPGAPTALSSVGGVPPEELADMSEEERRLQTFRPPGNAHYVATDDAGELLGVGGESWTMEGEGGPSGIDLYDVSDTANPTALATIEPPESPDSDLGTGVDATSHNFELRDGVLYSSWYRGGVKRHDVSDPTDPTELTNWRRPMAASMWTARVLTPGETFLAASKGIPDEDAPARLYVFPDADGRSVEPFPEPTGTPAATESPASTAEPPTDSPTPDPTPTGSPTDVVTEPESPASETSVPGFGAPAALGGAGLAAWRRLSGREES
ncbi:LVIVD repeat-containing protein [Halorarum halobium]|uniref:LVIVD repeat-containing protein n=1 Tax=Halorarum halobium TaxID=3075121 RepID=UPI0028B1D6B5|nr:hypothetical protein [Halobaculum sp. XH14]